MPRVKTVEHDGDKIKRARVLRDLTQAELARAAMCRPATITALETMTNKGRVGAALYGRICRVLRKNWDDLLRDAPGQQAS